MPTTVNDGVLAQYTSFNSITTTDDAAWHTIDAKTLGLATDKATGVFLRTSVGNKNKDMGVRPTGSGLGLVSNTLLFTGWDSFVPLNEDGEFDYYVGTAGGSDNIATTGETQEGFVGTTATSVSATVGSTWQDKTVPNIVSGDAGNIEAAVILVWQDAAGKTLNWGIRKKGESTAFFHAYQNDRQQTVIVGVDSNDQFQTYTSNFGFEEMYCVGYIKKNYGYTAIGEDDFTDYTAADSIPNWTTTDISSLITTTTELAVVRHYREFVDEGLAYKSDGAVGESSTGNGQSNNVHRYGHTWLCDVNDLGQILIRAGVTRDKAHFWIQGYLRAIPKSRLNITGSRLNLDGERLNLGSA